MDTNGALGLLASTANVLVMFVLVKDMKPRDKVLNIAFSVCAAFLIGDHLAYNLSIQPSTTIALFFGKLTGGIVGVIIGHFICKKKLHLLEENEEIVQENEETEKTLWEHIGNLYRKLVLKYKKISEKEMIDPAVPSVSDEMVQLEEL